MPLTPLHYPLAYVIKKAGDRAGLELDMAGLALGSFTPDLECLFFISARLLGLLPMLDPPFAGDRLVLHSILGSITLGALISMAFTLALYRIFNRGPKRPQLRHLYLSCALGNLSHVLIDAIHHTYNPLLFPFTAESVDVLVPMGDYGLGTRLAYGLVLSLSALILIKERGAGKRIFYRLLFEV